MGDQATARPPLQRVSGCDDHRVVTACSKIQPMPPHWLRPWGPYPSDLDQGHGRRWRRGMRPGARPRPASTLCSGQPRGEAEAAFGNRALHREIHRQGPATSEIRWLGDRQAIDFNLGERDCSIQAPQPEVAGRNSPARPWILTAPPHGLQAAIAAGRSISLTRGGHGGILLRTAAGNFFLWR